MLSGFWALQLVAAREEGEDDNLQTVSSDDYVPLVDDSDSDNANTTERLFHFADRQAVQRDLWVTAREYAQFHRWVVGHPGESGQVLVDTFHASLAAKYAVGQYPLSPMGPIAELPPSSPFGQQGPSPVGKLYTDDESVGEDRGGLMQGNYHAPAVHVLLTGGLVAAAAGAVARSDAVVAGGSLDGFDMEPLF